MSTQPVQEKQTMRTDASGQQRATVPPPDTAYGRKIQEYARLAGITINGPEPWDPQVYSADVYRRAFDGKTLGFGETYMENLWDCEALDDLFLRLVKADLNLIIRRDFKLLFLHLHNRFANRQSLSGARKVIDVHYNSGNEHFEKILGKYMAYSSAYFQDTDDLDEAQEKKLDLICRKLELKPTDRVLDIGYGWGMFPRFAAERYGCKIVGISPSEEQFKYVSERDKHLSGIEYIISDYRTPEVYNPGGEKFDKIVSVGMFEHVGYKNYRTYFQVAHDQLKEGGLFLLHTMGNTYRDVDFEPWTHRYIYPNGMAPSIAQIGEAIEYLFVMEDWHNFGYNYYRTYRKWLENLDAYWEDKSHPFYRMWRYFFMMFGGNFKSRKNLQLWQIVLAKGGVDGVYHSVR